MDKKTSDRDDVLEIIELATDDLQSLTKAFELITEVVSQYDQTSLELSEDLEIPVIH